MQEFLSNILQHFIDEIKTDGLMLFVFGMVAQLIFTGRFLFQWIISEKKGESVVPVFFWYMSLAGATMLLIYFVKRGEAVGAIGQSVGWIVYIRNVMLIHKNKNKLTEEPT